MTNSFKRNVSFRCRASNFLIRLIVGASIPSLSAIPVLTDQIFWINSQISLKEDEIIKCKWLDIGFTSKAIFIYILC